MLERLRAFLSGLSSSAADAGDPDDPRLAAAALLVHLADADGERSDEETATLRSVIGEAYGLNDSQTLDLIAKGEFADHEAVDFYRFTKVLSRALDRDAKRDFIAMMWDVAHADSRVDEMEDGVVWRIAELIGIEQAERVALRQAAFKRRAAANGGAA
jgi:uncharacterized tellurite resistance protein B-like protein